MPYVNPYIEKVENHPHVWIDEVEMFAQKGKWKEYF